MAINPTGANRRPHRDSGPMDHRRIQERPAQRIRHLQPGPGTAMGQIHRPQTGSAVAHFSVSDVAQFSMSLDTAPPPDSSRTRPAGRRTAPSAPPAGAGSLCTDRPATRGHATGGGEQGGRRGPWRMPRRTPEGSVPPIKASPPPLSASVPDIKARRAWPRPLARRGPWRGLRQRRPLRAQREPRLRGS